MTTIDLGTDVSSMNGAALYIYSNVQLIITCELMQIRHLSFMKNLTTLCSEPSGFSDVYNLHTFGFSISLIKNIEMNEANVFGL